MIIITLITGLMNMKKTEKIQSMKHIMLYEGFFDIFQNKILDLVKAITDFINIVEPELKLNYVKKHKVYFIYQTKTEIYLNIEKDQYNKEFIKVSLYNNLPRRIKDFVMDISIFNEDVIYGDIDDDNSIWFVTYEININNIDEYISLLTLKNYNAFIKKHTAKKFNL